MSDACANAPVDERHSRAIVAPMLRIGVPPVDLPNLSFPHPLTSAHEVSLDHLVSAHNDRFGHREAKRLGGLEINRQFEFSGLLHGKLEEQRATTGRVRALILTSGVHPPSGC